MTNNAQLPNNMRKISDKIIPTENILMGSETDLSIDIPTINSVDQNQTSSDDEKQLEGKGESDTSDFDVGEFSEEADEVQKRTIHKFGKITKKYYRNIDAICQRMISKIILFKRNSHYRFGDVVYHKGKYWEKSVQHVLKNNRYTNTILGKYNRRCPRYNLKCVPTKKFRCQLLKKIINEQIIKKQYSVPSRNELVIHIRSGDVVDQDWFLEKNYVRLIHNMIEKKKTITKCTIVTAFHFGHNEAHQLWIYDKNKYRRNVIKLKQLFRKLLLNFPNLQFNVLSTRDIDADFIYMVKSKHFVRDIGGFSALIQELRVSM